MKNLPVKVKILFTIITISVIGLGVFGYITFQTYKKDKIAFIYDYLSNETQSRSMLFSATVQNYDLFLSSIISKIDFRAKNLPTSTLKFLQDDKRVIGIYYQVPISNQYEYVSLFESEMATNENWNWAVLKEAKVGLTLLDEKKGFILFKKPLSDKNSFAAIVLKQVELTELITSNEQGYNFILNDLEIISHDALTLNSDETAKLAGQIKKFSMPFGLFEIELAGKKYFTSFARLNFHNFIMVNMIQTEKVLKVQNVFQDQVLAFLFLMASLSLMIGTLAARWLTWHIDQLTAAAIEMEKENFDIRVEFDSKDELGVLGNTFNRMGSKIKNLLIELKKYNTELEAMVEARTKELQQLTNIQKAMLNSLGQGFVIVNKEHKILPVYSKIAESMFEVTPDKSQPHIVMGADPDLAPSYKEFFELVFNQVLGFDDMIPLIPSNRSNSKHQYISLNYAPIKSETDELEYVLIIGTDKTTEIENQEKFKQEWAHSQMIQKVASNRFSINKIISDALKMMRDAQQAIDTEEKFAARKVQRLVHTLKGAFSAFYISKVTNCAHEFETYLTPFYDKEDLLIDERVIVLDKIDGLQREILNFIEVYEAIIQFKESLSHKIISRKQLTNFSELIKDNSKFSIAFNQSFFTTEVAPFFQMYPMIVKELSDKLNKEAVFKLEGGDLKIPEGELDELFQQFIHFVRNSMDHGIEPPDVRKAKGKSAIGVVTFKFEETSDKTCVKITLMDDGGGIDWKKLARKDSSITCEEDALRTIIKGGVSSRDEVSDISGRGVGVSSIFSTVEQWGGKAEFQTKIDEGTAIIMTIPLKQYKKQLQQAA